jgi:integration host factor subunit beta
VTKSGLIEALAGLASLTQKEAETVVDTVFDRIAEALAKGDKVELRGFGSFRVRHRRPRVGRNPKKQTTVEVPAKVVPFFRVGKELAAAVNKLQ